MTSTGTVNTLGTSSNGIAAVQSGGDGNVTVISTGDITSQGTGIQAGQAGTGGTISVTSTGNLTTLGDASAGISAVNSFADGAISITSTGDISTAGFVSYGIFVNQNGGSGDVTISSEGNISTLGTYASAIGAFNGNGDGNIVVTSVGRLTTTGDEAHGIEAEQEDGNGDITITSTGDIDTQGIDASGILASQSGGNGDVTVTSTGDISTQGDGADGIFAAQNGGDGDVTVTSTGDITASGDEADGVSLTNNDTGSLNTITLGGGVITGGTGVAYGVDLAAAAGTTTLNILGDATVTSASGGAVIGGSGDENINNEGTLIGEIDLEAGLNAINNLEGGLIESGSLIGVGFGNVVTNDGTISPGGIGTLQTTNLIGQLVQTETGNFTVDLDLANSLSDLLTVAQTTDLDGVVQVQVINPALGLQSQTVLSAAGGVTDSGLELLANPTLQAELSFPNPNDVVLTTNLDFTADGAGLNENQLEVGSVLNAITGAGGGELDELTTALLNGALTAEDFQNGLDQLGAEAFLNQQTAVILSSQSFANALLSCKEGGGTYAQISEGQCAWVQPLGRFTDRDQTSSDIGFDEDIGGLAAGVQLALSDNWSFGFGFGYETGDIETDANALTDVNRFQGGAVVKYQKDNWLFAGSVSAGTSQNETFRTVNFGNFTAVAESEPDITFVTAQARAQKLIKKGSYGFKPTLDLGITYFDQDSVTETGGGVANLTVEGGDDVFFFAAPSLEINRDKVLESGVTLRAFADLGFTVFSDNDHETTATLLAAPDGLGTFTSTTELDRIFGDVEAGATLILNSGSSLTLEYQGRFSDDTASHGVQARASFRF